MINQHNLSTRQITNKAVKFNRQRPVNKSDIFAKVTLCCIVIWTVAAITILTVEQFKV